MSANLFATLDDEPQTPPASASLPSYSDNWVLFSTIDSNEPNSSPCGCCGLIALDNGMWNCCNSNRSWLVLETPPDMSQPHDIRVCDGRGCRFHKFNSLELSRWHRGMSAGVSLGDLDYQEQQLALAQMSPEELARRRYLEAVADQKKQLELQSYEMRNVAERVAIRAHIGVGRGQQVVKKPQPCKKLYDCKPGARCGAEPTTLHVSTECWGWEYKDPATGKMLRPHTCPWLHPGEPGWLAQWNTNRNYKPPATSVDRFAGLGGGASRKQSQQGRR